jgi:hypothetical protein
MFLAVPCHQLESFARLGMEGLLRRQTGGLTVRIARYQWMPTRAIGALFIIRGRVDMKRLSEVSSFDSRPLQNRYANAGDPPRHKLIQKGPTGM